MMDKKSSTKNQVEENIVKIGRFVARLEEREKIKAYGEEINEETRNRNK